jgi:hypothetical protein
MLLCASEYAETIKVLPDKHLIATAAARETKNKTKNEKYKK